MSYQTCPGINLSQVVFVVNSGGSAQLKPVVDDRGIIIAVKRPGSGAITFHKIGVDTTEENNVWFQVVSNKLSGDGWIEGLPDGYSEHDCEQPGELFTIITKDN